MWITRKLKAKNSEATANKYVIRCMHVTMLILIGIWILNIVGIFRVSKTVMTYSVLLGLGIYAIGMVCWCVFGINKPCIKYFIILWTIMITTVLGTGLTYHALLATVIPILFCSLYSSKKMIAFTTALIFISTAIIVFVGYRVGICDANMVLLTGHPLSTYIGADGEFNNTHINDRVVWSLSLFYVVPRCLIYSMCMIACYNVVKLIKKNAEHAKRMEVLAEIDGMTGMYNKTKYVRVLANSKHNNEKVAVIYWDVNGLKSLNDTRGHECGDALIRVVADSILAVAGENDMAFRIGGDEFVMIMDYADVTKAEKKIQEWQNKIWELARGCAFDVTASVGYAAGLRADLKEVINTADKMMYEDKKKFHEQI